MTEDNTLKLLHLIAGENYVIKSGIVNGCIEFVHRKCGHSSICSVISLAKYGFTCSRCDEKQLDNMLLTTKEAKALELYKQCMSVLPEGFSVFGDTSSEDSVISVDWAGGQFSIRIGDLLNGDNLPDCLLHRKLEKSSVQLLILDKFIKNEFEILDDFDSLEDTIRIKNNITGAVISEKVKDVLERIVETYDKNSKQTFEII